MDPDFFVGRGDHNCFVSRCAGEDNQPFEGPSQANVLVDAQHSSTNVNRGARCRCYVRLYKVLRDLASKEAPVLKPPALSSPAARCGHAPPRASASAAAGCLPRGRPGGSSSARGVSSLRRGQLPLPTIHIRLYVASVWQCGTLTVPEVHSSSA